MDHVDGGGSERAGCEGVDSEGLDFADVTSVGGRFCHRLGADLFEYHTKTVYQMRRKLAAIGKVLKEILVIRDEVPPKTWSIGQGMLGLVASSSVVTR